MGEFGQKGSITDEGFMIPVLNNFPEKYDVILDGLGNCLMMSGDDALTIEIIRVKLNHWYEENKNKNEEKKKKKRKRKRKRNRSL